MYLILYMAGRNGWQIYDSALCLSIAEKIRDSCKYKRTRIINLLEDFK